MELRSLLLELLDQAADVRADAARVDPVIVVQVLERESREERVHATLLVVVDRYRIDLDVACLRYAELDIVRRSAHAQERRGAAMTCEHVAEISPTLSTFLSLQL